MRRRNLCLLRVLPCTCACALGMAQTIPPGYEIVDITSNNGRLEQFPRINNNGQVVYGSRFYPSNTEAEIWLYDSNTGVLTQITNDQGNDVFDGLPDIADDGTIVWSRWSGPNSTPEIMMRTPDGVVSQITDDDQEDWGPSINNRRQVVWKKKGPQVCPGIDSMEIYLYDGSEPVRLTTSGETFGYANQAPDINDSGDITWTEYDFCDPPPPYSFQSRMMLYSDGKARALPTLSVTAQVPSINEHGWVVWAGFDLATRRETVELWDGAQTVQITNDAGLPHMNDLGHIVFHRWDPTAGVYRIWLYRDGAFSLVSDDPLRSLTPRINDEGEIVWSRRVASQDADIRMLRRFEVGDLNCDDSIDAFDIEPFIVAMLDLQAYSVHYPACDAALADVNRDSVVDAFDIQPFTWLLVP